MPISLVQRVSPRGTLHVWVAVTPVTAAPLLQWTIDGGVVNPRVLKPLESARTAAQTPNPNAARAFAGLFEFDDPNPGLQHEIVLVAGAERASLAVRAIPAAVPPAAMSGNALRILLVSCFHTISDPRGIHAGRHAAEFIRTMRPDLAFFLGDQVYLDLPFNRPPGGSEADIAKDLENKYLANWIAPSNAPSQRGYYELLSAAPAIFNADDHEYWNNYPHVQVQLKNTLTPGRRESWGRAAERMFSVFQLHHGAPLGRPFVIDDIDPLSILFVDTRTMRKDDVLFDETGAATINAWADALARSTDRVGFLVTGQSIFDRKSFLGSKLDKNLLDFPKEYAILANAVRRATATRPVLCITGDVHFGRVLASQGAKAQGRLFEVISSPAALVDNPLKNFTAAINPFDDPVWPKHGDAPGEEKLHFTAFPGQQFVNAHAQRGNHITMLSLTRTGASVNVRAHYKPMHPKRDLPITVTEFTLR